MSTISNNNASNKYNLSPEKLQKIKQDAERLTEKYLTKNTCNTSHDPCSSPTRHIGNGVNHDASAQVNRCMFGKGLTKSDHSSKHGQSISHFFHGVSDACVSVPAKRLVGCFQTGSKGCAVLSILGVMIGIIIAMPLWLVACLVDVLGYVATWVLHPIRNAFDSTKREVQHLRANSHETTAEESPDALNPS